MANKISRRELFRDVSAAGAAAALAGSASAKQSASQREDREARLARILSRSSKDLLAEHENYQVEITAGAMIVRFDKRYGSISSIQRKGDEFGTNFIGNEINTPGVDLFDSRFTGDVVTTVWALNGPLQPARLGQNDIFKVSGRWKRELTTKSEDVRAVSFRENVFTVSYDGAARDEDGIRSYGLTMSYRAGEGSSLLWDIEIENVTGQMLEIGELALPLMVNDDYAELYYEPGGREAISGGGNVDFALTPVRQKLIHEQKVLVHHFIAGHSSYALIERPLGDAPFLLVHTTGDTPLECIYKDEKTSFHEHTQGWRGPDLLAIHSWATKDERRWDSNPWVNGHTSLLLRPGEKKSYQVRFAFISGYPAIRDEVYKAGNLGIRVLPSMVVQEGTDALVELKSTSEIDKIKLLSDNITIVKQERKGENVLLTLSFLGRGQKSMRLHYGPGRWTNLVFYCIPDLAGLLKARAKFIADRQFYKDPADPYHRFHCFLPFDYRIGSMFLDSDHVWEVGGSDEAGFSEPLFLAEKNVQYPRQEEVDALETYVTDCLFKYIQNPETYEVRASLYWKERYPSSGWGDWTKERSEATFRSYNYVHPANIYHALYRIGKRYGLLRRKKPEEYLRMSYHTCMRWFSTGPWRHIGLMEGSNAIHILQDIQSEGWQTEYSSLLAQMKDCDRQMVEDPYPYSSELIIDQTAHEQVYFFTKFFGDTVKNHKTAQVLKALRGGNQPVWFRYGNDKRGDICCWYNASLNGMALLDWFEQSGDPDAFVKGYAGVMSVMHNVLPDGMGFNHFICTPGIFDNAPPRTFESGPGLWGFLRSAKSYVIRDPAFGLIGCGCALESRGGQLIVTLKDGVRKRLRLVEEKIDFEAAQGEMVRVTWNERGNFFELEMEDSTGHAKTAALSIRGLAKGEYKVTHRHSSRRVSSDGSLEIEAPIAEVRRIKIEKG
jgi:Family of unknown function (DUF5695)